MEFLGQMHIFNYIKYCKLFLEVIISLHSDKNFLKIKFIYSEMHLSVKSD